MLEQPILRKFASESVADSDGFIKKIGKKLSGEIDVTPRG